MSHVLLRVARFTSGLPHCIALAFVALAGVHALDVNGRVAVDPRALAALAGLSLLVPVLSAVLVARKPFAERMLIIGMSPLARKILDEIATRADCPYVVVGVAGDRSESLEDPFPELHAGFILYAHSRPSLFSECSSRVAWHSEYLVRQQPKESRQLELLFVVFFGPGS